jgi:hypothetical protein
MEELVSHAHDYLVRFRPDAPLGQVREWAVGVRARMRVDALSVEDARAVYENARTT